MHILLDVCLSVWFLNSCKWYIFNFTVHMLINGIKKYNWFFCVYLSCLPWSCWTCLYVLEGFYLFFSFCTDLEISHIENHVICKYGQLNTSFFWYNPIISFIYVSDQLELPALYWISIVKADIVVIFPVLRRKAFSLSSLNIVLTVGSKNMPLIMWRKFFIPIFVEF